MRWFLVRLRAHCMFVIHCELVKHIACSSDLLHVHWADCMSVKLKIRQIRKLSCELLLRMSSIFDKAESLRARSFRCVSLEVISSSRRTRTNSTKIFFLLLIVESTDSFDWRCLIQHLMKRFCIAECQDRIWSIYSSWSSIVVFRAVSRNWLIQINF